MLQYRLPKLSDKKMLNEFLQEYFSNDEKAVILEQSTLINEFELWIERIEDYSLYGNDEWGRSLLLLCFDEDELIGILNVRYEMAPVLEAAYGNIGYSVRPSKRNQGYATQMLQHGLQLCKERGLKKVIVGCEVNNIASRKVIEKFNGIPFGDKGRYEIKKRNQYYLIIF